MSSTLSDFLRETRAEVKSQMSDGALYEELVRLVMPFCD